MSLAELLQQVFVRQVWHSDQGNAEGGSGGVWNDGLVMHNATLSLKPIRAPRKFRYWLPANGIAAALLHYNMPGTEAVCTTERKKKFPSGSTMASRRQERGFLAVSL